ncbi:MAG: ATP-dependent helicase HrpB [Bacterioplanes sp.]|nr:ATP-dependent helicase HrpB [Bacterioplanes sp.]
MSAELPIDEMIADLRTALREQPTVLLSAAPGAGKTTRVPLALLEEPWLDGQRIILLEPRRLAAQNAARFMAQQRNEPVGQTVGYRIRLDHKISHTTRIEVVTEGILTRMLLDDPELSGIGLVIFDEFHERNLHSDLALALTLQCQQLLRDDLRLLVMSATLDEARLAPALNAPLLVSAGRSFAVDVAYRPLPNGNASLIEHCARIVREALTHEGDVLVFLPGVREIHQLQDRLAQLTPSMSIRVCPLHGQLNEQDQALALQPAPAGMRKILLATNIAESSLTIDGVRIVVDSGLERRMSFQANSGLSVLTTRSISQASAAQRTGRAGRQAPGHCFRLWPESTHSRLEAHIRPEILDTDLAALALTIRQWGAHQSDLFWLTEPPANALTQAEQLLRQLGCLEQDNNALSAHGRACASLPIEPRWAHALLRLHAAGVGQEACVWVALWQEWPHALRYTDDGVRLRAQAEQHRQRWQHRVVPLSQRLWQALRSSASHLDKANNDGIQPPATDDIPALLIALAFPDRIAQRRANSQRFLLSHGQGAELLPNSDLQTTSWLACADVTLGQPSRIRLAVPLSDALLNQLALWLPESFKQQTEVGFLDNGQFVARRHELLGAIRLRSTPLPRLTESEWQDAWQHYVQQQGLACFTWSAEARQWRARMAIMHQHDPQSWPAVDDAHLLATLEHWLLPLLNSARHVRDLAKVDMQMALTNTLDWSQQQAIGQALPTHFTVPSGSQIAIDYVSSPPILAVKLQEMFGCHSQPTVLQGRLPIQVHLLSPARRPLQITADLAHFWRHTYADVRKDMRGRYPKHPWPEDPLTAQATRLTKAAQARQTTD